LTPQPEPSSDAAVRDRAVLIFAAKIEEHFVTFCVREERAQ
jgi:hypothetical protein